jgi:hypothetical protein
VGGRGQAGDALLESLLPHTPPQQASLLASPRPCLRSAAPAPGSPPRAPVQCVTQSDVPSGAQHLAICNSYYYSSSKPNKEDRPASYDMEVITLTLATGRVSTFSKWRLSSSTQSTALSAATRFPGGPFHLYGLLSLMKSARKSKGSAGLAFTSARSAFRITGTTCKPRHPASSQRHPASS